MPLTPQAQNFGAIFDPIPSRITTATHQPRLSASPSNVSQPCLSLPGSGPAPIILCPDGSQPWPPTGLSGSVLPPVSSTEQSAAYLCQVKSQHVAPSQSPTMAVCLTESKGPRPCGALPNPAGCGPVTRLTLPLATLPCSLRANPPLSYCVSNSPSPFSAQRFAFALLSASDTSARTPQG